MSIEKSLYEAPQGLSALAEEEPDIEIEIEDPEALKLSIDGEEILSMEKEDGEEDNLLLYFKDNKDLLNRLVEEKYENHVEILASINDNMVIPNQKITSKIGLISISGIANTKKIISEFVENQKWNYTFKYDSAPYYILESYTDDSCTEDHQEFINTLNSMASKNKVFSKIEYVGKI